MSAEISPRIPYRLIAATVSVVELVMIALASVAGPVAYAAVAGTSPSDAGSALGIGVLGGVVYLTVAQSTGLYHIRVLANASTYIGRFLKASGSVFLSLAAGLFLLKISSDFSRGGVVVFAVLAFILCFATRLCANTVVASLIERNAIRGRPVFLIGDGEELASVEAGYLLRQFGLSEVGRFALVDGTPMGDRCRQTEIAAALLEARDAKAKALVLAANLDHVEALARFEQAVRSSPLPLILLPNKVLRGILARNAASQDLTSHLISLQRAPLNAFEQALKRALDLVSAVAAFILLLPILVLTALAIKLDSSGPIIFRQRRNGFNQQPFSIYKFRTMKVLEDGPGLKQARKNDQRITRVGRFLRRTSIDELPQLWNVVKGEMSIVGPRPHALSHDDEYAKQINEYFHRHHVKPGMTGWAQVNGLRGETRHTDQMRRRVEHDLWYINNWSIQLDLRILLRTCVEVLGHPAY